MNSTLNKEEYCHKKLKDTFAIIEWIVDENQSFLFCESEHLRKNTNFKHFNHEKIVETMNLIKDKVIKKISDELPDFFSLEFDGWDNNYGSHLLAIFAVYPKLTDGVKNIQRALLTINTLSLDEGQNSNNILTTVIDVLSTYGKTLDNIVCFTGDNCNVNKGISNLTVKGIYRNNNNDNNHKIPLVGCKAHLLNLYVIKEFLVNHMETIKKVRAFMIKCRNSTWRRAIKHYTDRDPQIDNATRWISIYTMLERYYNYYNYIIFINYNIIQ
jgi:hypothetical protein